MYELFTEITSSEDEIKEVGIRSGDCRKIAVKIGSGLNKV
jgi:hypothetical protein